MKYTHVFIDCDSTLLQVELLDEIAKNKGVEKEVQALTEASMNGDIPLEEAMPKKMALIAPNRQDILELEKNLDEWMTPGAEDVVQLLQCAGIGVYILTNNFYPIVAPVAARLMIPNEHILAATMFLDEEGNYIGIESDQVLGKSDGKPKMIQQVMKGRRGSVHIGDSVSDLACQGTADLFVGFGGVCVRDKVKREAEIYTDVNDFQSLLQHLDICG